MRKLIHPDRTADISAWIAGSPGELWRNRPPYVSIDEGAYSLYFDTFRVRVVRIESGDSIMPDNVTIEIDLAYRGYGDGETPIATIADLTLQAGEWARFEGFVPGRLPIDLISESGELMSRPR